MAQSTKRSSAPTDSRIAIYRGLRALVFVLALGGLIKYGCIDTFPVVTDQMKPSLVSGDRIMVFKGAYRGPLSTIFDPRGYHPVVFEHPNADDAIGCLRIVGRPGDVVSVRQGMFHRNGVPRLGLSETAANCERLPPAYSPRDWTAPFRLPEKGDIYDLDTLSNRDAVFVFGMMRQERPSKDVRLQASLEVDGKSANDYIITDFVLYKGRFDSIPDGLRSRWFFWNRLEEYLKSYEGAEAVSLKLTIFDDDGAVSRYKVGHRFYFMLADQWCSGFDSRYFGPLSETAMLGRAVCVLWSFENDDAGHRRFRPDRLVRFIN
ncbi:MAG: hypothetical protein GF344_13540 [Chitinivibrionales bacterium]|nr:hypothetical protein [Chitinivibrionales bacterium]MBD3357754.1 hypothetical protein [Chitinivibrionales bacterium]